MLPHASVSCQVLTPSGESRPRQTVPSLWCRAKTPFWLAQTPHNSSRRGPVKLGGVEPAGVWGASPVNF